MPIRVGQMCFDPHSMMILAKIGFGAAASLYFDSPIVGTWWSALVCLAVVWSTYMESKVLILLISAVGVLACAAAVWLDLQLSTYFNETIRSCADWQSHPCYCAETQDEYLELTRFTGDLECNNPFTRNPSYLTGNTFLTALTAFITLVVFLSTVGMLCGSMCFCLFRHHREAREIQEEQIAIQNLQQQMESGELRIQSVTLHAMEGG
mmetsp:Transcript_19318/g.43066  ORF Transcript_19318/g.43066 Transcript_19318/m.43066 type:complete len:208 (-) Transcript_19318:72-695(-)